MGLDGKFDELLNQLILIYCTHAETPREVHARTHSDEAPSPHATLIEFVHRHPCQCPGEVFGFRGLHPGALHQAEQHQPEPQSKLQSRPLAWASPQYLNLSLKLNLNITIFVGKGLFRLIDVETDDVIGPSILLVMEALMRCEKELLVYGKSKDIINK